MKRIVLSLLFGALAVSNVAIHDDKFGDFAFGVADSAGDRFENPPASVFVVNAIFKFFSNAGAAGFAGGFEYLETIVGMNLIEGRGLSQFGCGIAKNAAVGG